MTAKPSGTKAPHTPETRNLLTAHWWGLVIALSSSHVSPFFHPLTREVSLSGASAGDVILSPRAPRRLLSTEAATDHDVKTTKTALLPTGNKRFETNPISWIATSLDPRYKDRYFDKDVNHHPGAALDG